MNHGISEDTINHLTRQAARFSEHATDARTRAYDLDKQAAATRIHAARQESRAQEWRTLAALATGTELPRLERSDADRIADVFRVGASLVSQHPELPQPNWSPSPDHLVGSFWGPTAVDDLTLWADALGAEVVDDPILPVQGREAFKVTAEIDGIHVWLRGDRPRDTDTVITPASERSAA
ncbi:hypothetical protein AB0I72_19670 [Nocardiopsis sp. NPDC049922]|uniref:hypothetical protein n=1 Tax=Nocardiopsis sp. NPDC049922 TaxID=3155157 RepID=UPI0033D05B51